MQRTVRTLWSSRPWLPILGWFAAADIGARIAFGFDSRRVPPIEAALLGATGAFILATSRRADGPHRGPSPRRAGELALAAALALGALRASLVSAGLPVPQANLGTVAAALLLALGVLRGRRASRERDGAPGRRPN